MPNYTYKCIDCSEYFDKFLPLDRYDEKVECEYCGGKTNKVLPHIFVINKGSEHRDIDCIVGEDAEKKWEKIHKKQDQKKKDLVKTLKTKKESKPVSE